MNYIIRQIQNLNSATNTAELKGSAERAFINGGLDGHCGILDTTKRNGNVVSGDFLSKEGWSTGRYQLENEKIAEKYVNGLKATHKNSGLILANMDKMGLNLFHEMGHQLNTQSATGKFLQHLRMPTNPKFAFLIPLGFLLIPGKKPAEGEEQSGLQKTANFVKKYAAPITFVAYMPLLIEEGMASIKGNKLAKKFCSEPMFKNVVKNNRWGFFSYALGVAGITLSSFVASKINNKKASSVQLT